MCVVCVKMVELLNNLYLLFDDITDKYRVYKVMFYVPSFCSFSGSRDTTVRG